MPNHFRHLNRWNFLFLPEPDHDCQQRNQYPCRHGRHPSDALHPGMTFSFPKHAHVSFHDIYSCRFPAFTFYVFGSHDLLVKTSFISFSSRHTRNLALSSSSNVPAIAFAKSSGIVLYILLFFIIRFTYTPMTLQKEKGGMPLGKKIEILN